MYQNVNWLYPHVMLLSMTYFLPFYSFSQIYHIEIYISYTIKLQLLIDCIKNKNEVDIISY